MLGCSAGSHLFEQLTVVRETGPVAERLDYVGSVIKKRRKRMAKKKHRKLLKKTRIQRRRAGR